MNLVQEIVEFHEDMTAWRRDFHRHPELARREVRTAGKVAKLLRSFGVDKLEEGLGKTGVVAVVRNGEGPSVGFRADMDALPICEAADHDHVSELDQVMHACGHDGHTAMLLGAARYLARKRNFRGSVVFIFQPSEEVAHGAREMIEDGLFDRFQVDSVFGLHNWPGRAAGTMCIMPGAVMAAVNTFTIQVTGHGGHAAMPPEFRDPIAAGAAIVTGMQNVVPRNVEPTDPVVVSVTSFQSSSNSHNVIPPDVEIKGTVRYLNPELADHFPHAIRLLAENTAVAYGVTASVTYEKGCPPTVNTEKEVQTARQVAAQVVGPENLFDTPPKMGGEDFSFFLEKKPGAFAFVGNGEGAATLHNPCYDFNDEILPVGASFFVRLAEFILK